MKSLSSFLKKQRKKFICNNFINFFNGNPLLYSFTIA